MLIAEDLLLLLLDDETGTGPSMVDLTPVLGGAVLVELAMADSVRLGEKSGFWSTAKVFADPAAAPQDPILAAALGIVAAKQRSAADLVTKLGKGLREVLSHRLAERGILRRADSKVLGLFPRTTWPAADVARERELRQALTGALIQGVTPDERTAALIGLLHAAGRSHKTVPLDGVPARDVKARAKAIAEGDWAAKAVKDAIAAAMSSTVATTSAAT